MRAVVTGGAGFLGSHLVDRLISEGWDVVAIDNFITGSPDNLRHLSGSLKLQLVEQDITAFIKVDGPVDFVFNFACPASPDDFRKLPLAILKAGSLGTHNALGLARAKGAKFLTASTSEVYGDPTISPQPETYWGHVNPIGTRSVYDESKRFSESLTMAYHRVYGLDTKIVRFFNTYGPRMRLDDGRVVPNFVGQALKGEPLTIYGDGLQTRSFGFYRDIIDGVWRLAHSSTNEPVNIGADTEETILEFAEAVLKATKSKSQIVHLPAASDDPRQRRPDLARAKDLLGWQPTTPLGEVLAETIEYFRGKLAVSIRP